MKEFEEIAHSGGKVTLTVIDDSSGSRKYQLSWTHCRPNHSGLFAVYALPQGLVVGNCRLGGIGSEIEPPPVDGAQMVMIGSDSEGRYGHECPACGGYWRSSGSPATCPYCALKAPSYQFLTQAQRNYVREYLNFLDQALMAEQSGEYVIDLDAVADAANKDGEKPPFYYTEERQQNRFDCFYCGEFNDILGRFGYCCRCGTRNDLVELHRVLEQFREQLKAGGSAEETVKGAVGAFDSFCAQYVGQLRRIPMTPRRRERLGKMRFHNLSKVVEELNTIFDINILSDLASEEIEFAKRMFFRRHVYEHNGGEVDDRYLEESGDKTVRLKQLLREEEATAHRLLGTISRMAKNLHDGFHLLRPVNNEPIEHYKSWSQRMGS